MMKKIFVSFIIVVTSLSTYGQLVCEGANVNNSLKFHFEVNKLKNNVLTVSNLKKEKCSCQFQVVDYSNMSRAVTPTQSLSATYQTCDEKCPVSLKKEINALIVFSYRHLEKKSELSPFSKNGLLTCKNFSINSELLKKIEIERISKLDDTKEFKQRLIEAKGLNSKTVN